MLNIVMSSRQFCSHKYGYTVLNETLDTRHQTEQFFAFEVSRQWINLPFLDQLTILGYYANNVDPIQTPQNADYRYFYGKFS